MNISEGHGLISLKLAFLLCLYSYCCLMIVHLHASVRSLSELIILLNASIRISASLTLGGDCIHSYVLI